MSAVTLIISRVQNELRDFGGTWTDPDYICRVLSTKNEDFEQEMQSLDLNFDTQVVIVPNIPANTTDLSSYQEIGGPLATLISPIKIEWRLAGENQEEWEVVPNVQSVVDTDTGTGEPGAPVQSDTVEIESFEWRNGVIYISPSMSVVDLRIRFQGFPALLNADSPQQPVRGAVNILVYWICWSTAKSRGGPASVEAVGFKGELDRSKQIFVNAQIKFSKHPQVQRLGGRRSGMPQGIGIWRPPTA